MSLSESYSESYAVSHSFERFVLGTAGLGGIWGAVDRQESIEIMLRALELGIGHIDTAPAYNNSEEYLGDALRQWGGRKPFVSTKVGRLKADKADVNLYDYSRQGLEMSLHNSLKTLSLSYVDLLFLHEPQAVSLPELPYILEVLQEFRQQGLIKAIGIGGNYPVYYKPFLADGIFDVVMGYNRFNACSLEAFYDEIPFLQANGVHYYQGSPLNMGLLGARLNQYLLDSPSWISEKSLRIAEKLNRLCENNQLELADMATKFLKASAFIDKVVMGPRTSVQFQECINYWQNGELTQNFYSEIININANQNTSLHVTN